jgi:hypothetical protein
LEDISVDEIIILKLILKKDNGKMLTYWALDKHKWRAVVNKVMKRGVPYKAGDFLAC